VHGTFVRISHSYKTLLNDYNMVEMSKNVLKFECTFGFERIQRQRPLDGQQASSICRIHYALR